MRYVTVVSKGILSLDAILWRGPEPAPGMRAETLPGGARYFHLEVRLGRAAPCGDRAAGGAGATRATESHESQGPSGAGVFECPHTERTTSTAARTRTHSVVDIMKCSFCVRSRSPEAKTSSRTRTRTHTEDPRRGNRTQTASHGRRPARHAPGWSRAGVAAPAVIDFPGASRGCWKSP